MSVILQTERVVILVKAVPRPSRRHGETVCCAGVTIDREWKRLFPIRFRALREQRFKRWEWVRFGYGRPLRDPRPESCRVAHETVSRDGILHPRERARLLEPMIERSISEAAARGRTLALVRPKNPLFFWKRKTPQQLAAEAEGYRRAVAQRDLLDEQDLRALEPVPYLFRFAFDDADGHHRRTCEDWETNATFWKWRREYGEAEALERLAHRYNVEYPDRGIAFAMGTMLARPQLWLLLGVLRLDEGKQSELF